MEQTTLPPTEATPKARCKKCGKPYLRTGKFLSDHEESCDGTPWVESPDKAAHAPPPPPEPEKPPPTNVEILLEDAKSRKEALLKQREELDGQRDGLQKELDQLTLAVVSLERAKTEVDKSLVTSDCGNCNAVLDQLKTAQWDKFDAELQRGKISDTHRRFMLWLNETVKMMRLKIRVPTPEELERMYPMLPTEREPQRPKLEDPRPPKPA